MVSAKIVPRMRPKPLRDMNFASYLILLSQFPGVCDCAYPPFLLLLPVAYHEAFSFARRFFKSPFMPLYSSILSETI